MTIGYARISTAEQSLATQEDALTKAGCDKVFTDVTSGANDKRPGYTELLTYARKGDTILVTHLDRLGRSLKQLIQMLNDLSERGINIKSLGQEIDTTTATGKMMFHVFASLAEFERGLTIERTHAGLAAARARGRFGGRPRKIRDPRGVEMIKADHAAQELTIPELLKKYRLSRATFYRVLKS
jgi:DNA invertase Pin-like site-specific DNA recombinase